MRRLSPLPAAAYNSTSVLAAHGLSWWEDVTPKLTQSFGGHYLSRSTGSGYETSFSTGESRCSPVRVRGASRSARQSAFRLDSRCPRSTLRTWRGSQAVLALPRPLDPPRHSDRVLAISGLDTGTALARPADLRLRPRPVYPVLNDDFETEWLPVLGPTGTVLTRVPGPSRWGLPFEHRARGACLSGRAHGSFGVPTMLDRAERFALILL